MYIWNLKAQGKSLSVICRECPFPLMSYRKKKKCGLFCAGVLCPVLVDTIGETDIDVIDAKALPYASYSVELSLKKCKREVFSTLSINGWTKLFENRESCGFFRPMGRILRE